MPPAAKTVTVAGLDPGPKPGTVWLAINYPDLAHAVEGPPTALYTVTTGLELEALLTADFLAVERYVIQGRSGRVKDKAAQAATLAMAEEAYTKAVAKLGRDHVQRLGPGNVKPWATDQRLERYGLTVKGGHHRDALRHALYYAVRLGLLPRR